MKGFTLLEILIAIALLSMFSTLVYVNIDPIKRFEEARNKQRVSDIYDLMQAIKLHRAENSQLLPSINSLDKNLYYQIGSGVNCDMDCSSPSITLEDDCLDLSSLSTSGYIPQIPYDPSDESASDSHTRYYLSINDYDIINIGACSEEKGADSSPKKIEIKN